MTTDASIIVPFFNEEDNVDPVLAEVRDAMPGAEIIAVNDGSTDGTAARLARTPGIVTVSFPHNLGQSAALYAGLLHATRSVCVMMDGDGQNDSADIPRLIAALEWADVACGYRLRRQDDWRRRAASRCANAIRRAVLHDGVRDTGCSLKAVRREHVRFLVPFNGLHRYLPAFFRRAGLSIVEVPVNPRRARQPRRRAVGRSVVDRDDFSSGHRAAQLGQHGVDVVLFVEKWHNDAGVGRHDFVPLILRPVRNHRVEILKQLGYKSRGGIFP